MAASVRRVLVVRDKDGHDNPSTYFVPRYTTIEEAVDDLGTMTILHILHQYVEERGKTEQKHRTRMNEINS